MTIFCGGDGRSDQLLADEAFGESDEFGATGVGFPADAAIVEDRNDGSAEGTAKRFDAVARLPVRGFAKALDDLNHAVAVEDARNVVGDGGANLAFTAGGKIGKKSKGELAANGCKSVPVEEEKGRAAMKGFKKVDEIDQRELGRALFFPLRRARACSFRVKAMLRFSSFARSSIDADDRLPVPVFDKSGSGLKR